MKLTPAQMAELQRLAREPQHTYGKARVRVQNNLQRLGLAYVGGSWCEITAEGRAVLAARPAPAAKEE